MPEAVITTVLQLGPPDWLVSILRDITGKRTSLYTLPDLVRFVLTVSILGYAAIRNSNTGVDHAWKALYVVGVPLLLYTMIFNGTLNLVLQAAVNIGFVSGVAALGVKLGVLSNDGAKMLTGVAILIPTYPFLTVFPITRSILPLPFNMFAFTILFYFSLLVLVYGAANMVRNREYTDVEPVFRFLGKPMSTETVHEGETVILQSENGFATDLKTSELREYLEWTDRDSIADVERVYAEKFAESQLDELPDEEIIEAFQQRLEWLSQRDTVWVMRTPGLSRFLFIATLLAMLLGDLPFHVIF